jgi:chorismate mutase-like protein
MAGNASDLEDLRRRLDAIDNGLHDLLIERAEIVSRVGDHKRTNRLSFYQPAREAEIIRRLAARHRGPFALGSLVRIWRELLAAGVSLEAPFAVAVYAPPDAPGFWDLARDHFGSGTPLSAYASIGGVICAVAAAPASAGVLPLPQEGEADPWWRHLLSQDKAMPWVIARLPFGPRGNARGGGAGALVIGHGAPQATGRDRTLIVAETAEIGRARMLGLLAALDLDCTFCACCDPTSALIELDGFVPPDEPRLERFRTQLGPNLHRLVPLGGYALPLASASGGAAE